MGKKLAARFSALKYARRERKYVCGGSTYAAFRLREFNRAVRRAGREECRAALQEAV